MADKKYLDHVRDRNNKISSSFCAAKWYNSTVWLSNGRTASCHHPQAHYIPSKEIFDSPSALHNTNFKKEIRKQMLEGTRPDECNYCWRVEDADKEVHSDRTYKSALYTDKEIEEIKNIPWDQDVDPKTLEISFDNLCNLACSYCNAEFSSTWSNDIKKNGMYKEMKTDGGMTYQNDGSHAYAFEPKRPQDNFYIRRFFEWFDESLRYNLQELRVTGGEPTRSPQFWELVEKCQDEKFKFAVNSNLIMDQKRLDKLIDCSKKFKEFDLYTSCEAHGDHAELLRAGLDYNMWLNNLKQFAEKSNSTQITIMMTISWGCLFSITKFLDDIIELKKQFNNKNYFNLSVNLLRFPSFQSVNVLPSIIKQSKADEIDDWITNNKEFLKADEANQLQRLVSYLRKVDKSYDDTDTTENKENDFKKFFTQYTERRNQDIIKIVNDDNFTAWWESINV